MSIVKVIEVIAGSEKSFEDAVQNALNEASKSVKNIESIYVKNFKANVTDGKIVSYGIDAKISFKVEKSWMMKNESKENPRKKKEVDPSDDTLGENTEQTPLAKEVRKGKQEKENKKRSKDSDQ